MGRRRVLFVGWDAADWKVIEPLIDAGHMPHLARLLERGVMGNLASLQPMLSPMLWTSIATGKRPYKHGVHGFSEVAADSGGVRPISSLSRSTKVIWNILHQAGKTCHVVGWWPSHPVEPLRGAMVSNHFQVAGGEPGAAWPLVAGTVHPPELAGELAPLRIHPAELEGVMLRAFVPRAPEIDQEKDRRLAMLAKIVAESATVHAAATHLLHTRPEWDFCGIYQDAIDHFSHGFMRYHPPRLPHVPEEDFAFYSQVVGGAYVYHDTMLGVLLGLAGEDVTVVLVSDHGFHCDHLRPRDLPNEPAGPAAEHRPFGIFVAAGPGIHRDELVFGGSLLDITPTLLTLFGLPVGRDMDGRPLMSIFDQPPAVEFIDSWDDLPGEAALHDAAVGSGPVSAAGSDDTVALIRQLADLGYIDELPADRQEAIDQTVREQRWNLARALADGGRLEEAAAMLSDLWDRWPDETRFGVALLNTQIDLAQLIEARDSFALLADRKQTAMQRAVAELQSLLARLRTEQGLPEASGDELQTGLDPAALPAEAQRAVRRLSARARLNARTFAFLEGRLLAAERRYPEALAAFERTEGVEQTQRPAVLLERAEVLLAMRKPAAAAEECRRALDIDPVNPTARFLLARAAFAQQDAAGAAAEARAAIGHRYHFPRAHLLAGVAHWRAGDVAEAERFLRSAVALQPVFPAAHRMLGSFLARVRGDYAAAAEHRRLAVESRRLLQQMQAGVAPEGRHVLEMQAAGESCPGPNRPAEPFTAALADCIVVVTGLPRSGTSMMMQMLAAGGLPVLADDHRLADESNPRGYLELDRVKRLVSDSSWIGIARGKAVKVVSPLVRHLPRGKDAAAYLVVHMHRPVAEVVRSQRVMLTRSGRPGADIGDEPLVAIFERQQMAARTFLAHLEANGRARVLDVRYHSALADPAGTAARLAEFFAAADRAGGAAEASSFDAAAAAAAVDGSLHRTRLEG